MLMGVLVAAVASAQVCIQPEVNPNAPTIPVWPKSFGKATEAFPSNRILAVDGVGNAYVTGQTTLSEIGLWKYSPAGTLLGYVTLSYPSGSLCGCTGTPNGHGMVVLAESVIGGENTRAVYVAGTVKCSATGYNIVFAKFLSSEESGQSQLSQQWLGCYNNLAQNGTDYPVAMALDSASPQNVWIAGASDGLGTSTDIVVLGVNTETGGLFADPPYRYAGTFVDTPADIGTLHTAGAGESPSDDLVFVTGTTYQTGRGTDILTLCLDEHGSTTLARWDHKFTRVVNPVSEDIGASLAVQNANGATNVYVLGSAKDPNGTTGHDYVTLKYNALANGDNPPQFGVYYDGENHGSDFGARIALTDPSSAGTMLVVTGSSFRGSPAGSMDIATIGYGSGNGTEAFRSFYNNPEFEDRAVDLLVRPGATEDAHVYVSGFSSNGTNYDFVTVRINPLAPAVPLGVARYNSAGPDSASALRFGPFDDTYLPHLYVLGRSTGLSAPNPQYTLMRYRQTNGSCP